METLFSMVGASFTLILTVMTILWLIYLFSKNAAIVDVGWTVCVALAGWVYFWMGEGYWVRRWVLITLVSIWAVRLGSYLLARLWQGKEDPRYQKMGQDFGGDYLGLKFLMFFWFQGLIALILSLAFLIPSRDIFMDWSDWQTWGLLFWVIGFTGESVADYQLAQFLQNPTNRTSVCERGLWYYSRHPNYFFEVVTWIGFFFYAFASPWGSIAIIAPILMLFLLVKVTGIPPLEEHLLKTRGEAYREYQRTTSAFFPWFKSS